MRTVSDLNSEDLRRTSRVECLLGDEVFPLECGHSEITLPGQLPIAREAIEVRLENLEQVKDVVRLYAQARGVPENHIQRA